MFLSKNLYYLWNILFKRYNNYYFLSNTKSQGE